MGKRGRRGRGKGTFGVVDDGTVGGGENRRVSVWSTSNGGPQHSWNWGKSDEIKDCTSERGR